MLDLESAIKHCEEKAEELDELSKQYDEASRYFRNHNKDIVSVNAKVNAQKCLECFECAKEHRQLADWLKELKGLREDEGVKDVFKNCYTCKYIELKPDDYPCDRCMHRYINQYVYDDKREVNADG